MSIKIAQENSLKMNSNRFKVAVTALVCLLTVVQTGCSIHMCTDKNCNRPRGISFRSHAARAVGQCDCHDCTQTGSPASATTDYSGTQNASTNAKVRKLLSYEEGVQAGLNYARKFQMTAPIATGQPLPRVFSDADFGEVFENGCRDGISRAIQEQLQVKSKSITPKFINPIRDNSIYARPQVISQPVKQLKPVPVTKASSINETNSEQQNPTTSSFVPEPFSQPVYARLTDEILQDNDQLTLDRAEVESDLFESPEYAMPKTILNREATETLVREDAIEAQPATEAESTEAESIEAESIEAEIAETENVVNEKDENQVDNNVAPGHEFDAAIDALFDKSHSIKNAAPQVDWQPTATEPAKTEPVDVVAPTEVANNADPAPITEDVVGPTIDLNVEPAVESQQPITVNTESTFKPYPAAQNSLRALEDAVTTEPATQDPITEAADDNVEGTLETVPTPASKAKEDKLILSATVVPFRRRSPTEHTFDGKMERLTQPPVTKKANPVPRLRAIPGNRAEKRVPRFKPANSLKTSVQKAGPQKRKSVLINKMDSQKIELDPITKLNATPYSNLNSNLKPNLDSRAIYQSINSSESDGGIKGEKADVFFLPPTSTKK